MHTTLTVHRQKSYSNNVQLSFFLQRKGSVKVRFRIKIVVPVKDRSQTTRVQINTTQTLIDRGKNGFIGNLQVDAQPEAMEISGMWKVTQSEKDS